MTEDHGCGKQEGQGQQAGPGSKRPGLLLAVLAAADYLLYWVLVFYFPGTMIPVSACLGFFVFYLRKNPGLVYEGLDNLGLAPPGAEWIARWLDSWVATLCLGVAFALYRVF
ncbi:MAG: hypothetical protein JXQ83_02095 [Candidatus Glassbacteria bacterium]|nr:hypothetical protein [Candidatus Glassbacteria bacterium]